VPERRQLLAAAALVLAAPSWCFAQQQLVVVFMSAAPGPIRWHYRRMMNALVYQSIVE